MNLASGPEASSGLHNGFGVSVLTQRPGVWLIARQAHVRKSGDGPPVVVFTDVGRAATRDPQAIVGRVMSSQEVPVDQLCMDTARGIPAA